MTAGVVLVCCSCDIVVESRKTMSESEDNSECEAQIGGGRASVESVSEFLKEFKSARMSFEPLDTWLFVKARDNSHSDVESASDCNDVSAVSESDSSVVYQFDSDEMSSSDGDDDNSDNDAPDNAHTIPAAASGYASDDSDVEKPLIVKNLANSPGRSGCGVKVFSEEDRGDDEHTVFASPDESFSSRNSIHSVQRHAMDALQPVLSSVFSLNSVNRVCSCDAYEGCDDDVPDTTTYHENVTYRTDESYKEIHNTCGIMDKFESSGKSHECAVTYSASYRYAKQNLLNMESAAGTLLDGSTAECNFSNLSDVNSTGEVDVNSTLKRTNKRQRIAQELMDTEATYQRHLELIIQV